MSNSRWKTIGKIIKYTGIVCVFAVIGFLILRMITSKDPQSVKTLLVNEKTYEAYRAGGNELTMYYQNQLSDTLDEHNKGYFSVSQVAFIPEAEQLQLVVRYNNSTIKALSRDLGLPEVPDRSEELIDVSVVLTTDLTPDNEEDNYLETPEEYPELISVKRYYPSKVMTETKNIYNYRKYIFDGVKLDELTLGGFVDIYYCGKDAAGIQVLPDYDNPPVGTLCIYYYKSQNRIRKLTAEDRRALEAGAVD